MSLLDSNLDLLACGKGHPLRLRQEVDPEVGSPQRIHLPQKCMAASVKAGHSYAKRHGKQKAKKR
jgi:hypothetical protein